MKESCTMWKPKRDRQKFWYLDMFFKPQKKLSGNFDEVGKRLLRNHNCFRTRKEAADAAYTFQFYLVHNTSEVLKRSLTNVEA